MLTADEQAVLDHVKRLQEMGVSRCASYPVVKYGRRWLWTIRSFTSEYYGTREEACRAFEAFLVVLHRKEHDYGSHG